MTQSMLSGDSPKSGRRKRNAVFVGLGLAASIAVLTYLSLPTTATTSADREISATSSASAGEMNSTNRSSAATQTVAAVRLEPESLDLGALQPGNTGHGVVYVVNDGDRPIRIDEIMTTCGCTVAERPARPIQPGERVPVAVRMKASEAIGKETTKRLTFVFDEGVSPVKLSVSSTAKEFVGSSTKGAQLRPVNGESIELVAKDETPFRILEASAPVVSWDADKSVTHEILFAPSDAGEGKQKLPRTITLKTDHPRASEVRIRLQRSNSADDSATAGISDSADLEAESRAAARSANTLRVFPRRLRAMIDPETGRGTTQLTIRDTTGALALSSIRVESEHDHIEVSITQINARDDGLIDLSLEVEAVDLGQELLIEPLTIDMAGERLPVELTVRQS